MMPFDYKKLWMLLMEKDMKKKDLEEKAGLSSATIAKLTKGETVTTEILERICRVLGCDIGDIMELKS